MTKCGQTDCPNLLSSDDNTVINVSFKLKAKLWTYSIFNLFLKLFIYLFARLLPWNKCVTYFLSAIGGDDAVLC